MRKFYGKCNLVRDAEVKTIQTSNGQTTVCQFVLASNDDTSKNGETIYIECSIWGKRAESSLPTYLKKGKQVFVSGNIKKLNAYVGKDNHPKANLILDLESLDFGGDSSSTSRNNDGKTQRPEKKPETPAAPKAPTATASSSSSDWDDSGDLPF